MAITDYQMSEIKRKAGLGEKMLTPDAEKMKIYNQYAKTNNPYAVKPQPQINKPPVQQSYGVQPKPIIAPTNQSPYGQQTQPKAPVLPKYNPNEQVRDDYLRGAGSQGYKYTKTTEGYDSYLKGSEFLSPDKLREVAYYNQKADAARSGGDLSNFYAIQDYVNNQYGRNGQNNFTSVGSDRDTLGYNNKDSNGDWTHDTRQQIDLKQQFMQQGYDAQRAYDMARIVAPKDGTQGMNSRNVDAYNTGDISSAAKMPGVSFARSNANSYGASQGGGNNQMANLSSMNAPMSANSGIPDYQMSEIIRKAQLGIPMDKPTAEKQAVYDQYAKQGFDQDSYLKRQQDQVNSIYNNQKQSQMAQFTAERDKALGLVNQQKSEVAPQYAGMRNQTDVVNAQNVSKLREMMAANGISGSGENVTANVGLQSARQGALSQLNLQEQQTNNDFNRQITDINNPDKLNAMIAQLEAQRSEALFNATNRADEVGYSRRRDSISDARYADETKYGRNYQTGRDSVADKRYDQQFGYQAGRDKVGDSQWKQQYEYQKGRDGVGDSQWDKQFNAGRSDVANDRAWRTYQYNNMSASDKAQMAQNASQFGEEMAWRMYSQEYQGELDKSMSNAQLEAYKNGNFNGGTTSTGLSQADLGALSRKYESSGNPATVARTKGDLGGASYGSYQLTTSSGHAQSFANAYGGALKGLKAGTSAFDSAWKKEASRNPKAFNSAQHNYIERNHYEPAANRFQSITGINLNTMPKAVKDMVWSIGVQHGAGGAASIFKNAGVRQGMNAAQVISRVYNERMNVNRYFPSSPQSIKNGVLNRFKRELSDALNMLR